MPEPRDDRPLDELELLRPPARSDLDRARARRAILTAAAPIFARRGRQATSWEVLAGWARPGLVAAGIALAVAIGAVQLGGSREPSPEPVLLEDVLVGEGGGAAVLAVLVGNREPDADAVMAAALVTRGTEPAPPITLPEREER
jgi:hypothetical protein